MSDNMLTKFCRLTCDGGSECGQCPCEAPNECPMTTRADFEGAKRKAARRMLASLVLAPLARTGKP